MSSTEMTGKGTGEPRGLRPEDPALAVPQAFSVIYILPERRKGGWRAWRTETATREIKETEISPERARELATDEHAKVVTVFQTPAWVETAQTN